MTDKAIPILPSHDLDLTAAMYGRIGFTQTGRWPGYTIIERGPLELHFHAAPDHDPGTQAGVAYLRVDDVDTFHAEVVAAGFEDWRRLDPPPDLRTRWENGLSISRAGAPEDKPWGLREFALLDEDNNLIRIGQILAPRT